MASTSETPNKIGSSKEEKELRFTAQKKKRLETLLKEKAAREKEIERLLSAQKAEDRKKDTRKKVLAGACFLHALEKGTIPEELAKKILHDGLTKDRDRQMFSDVFPDLTPEKENSTP